MIDLGCEWLHSADRNVLVQVARDLRFTVDEGTPNWGGPRRPQFPEARAGGISRRVRSLLGRAGTAAESGGADRPASDFLPPGGRWNALIQSISTYYNGTELENVSVVDLGRYEDSGVNWTIREGYGAMLAAAAGRICRSLSVAVAHRIDHSGKRVRVETSRGTIETGAVIVTLPTPLIAGGALASSGLAGEDQYGGAPAARSRRQDLLRNHRGFDAPEGHLYGAIDSIETISFDIFPAGGRLVAGFLGAFARRLEHEGVASDGSRRAAS